MKVDAAHVDEHWEKYGPGAVGIGWHLGLFGLGLHLEDGATTPPEESVQWMASEDGKAFVSGPGEGWGRAAIAEGDEAAAAIASAKRAIGFYTGEPQG